MHTEIEAKFLDVDIKSLRSLLRKSGAELVYSERLMKRKTYDDPDHRMHKVGGWVRLRHEGDKITLSYKQLNDRTLHGTKEITVEVNDFDVADSFLRSIGLIPKSDQETKREFWRLDSSEITIDTWPWIPTFVEIEAGSEEVVRLVANRLGFEWSQALHGSVETAYQRYYDVTEEEVDFWKSITFVPVPEWLEKKRRK